MKNHFIIAYSGNKRNEVETIYNYLKDKLDNKKIIIEPFCGTSAFSYYLSTLYPKKFKYVLNDKSKYLCELYKLMKDEKKLKEFTIKLNEEVKKIINKSIYDEIINKDNLLSWFIAHKIYCIRAGLYRIGYIPVVYDFNKIPIIKFLREEEVEIYNKEGINIIEEYANNEEALLFIDPPYLKACNDFYDSDDTNVYEYFYNNNISSYNAYLILVLEDNWIIKLLFKNDIKFIYDKTYAPSKKKTQHIIITNKLV
jgi:hypothetical protein